MTGLTDASQVTFFDPYPETKPVQPQESGATSPSETFFELDAVRTRR